MYGCTILLRSMPDDPQNPKLDALGAALARVGSPLNAKWTLEHLLGVGGMAAVFAARHRNGTRAAVKILNAEFIRDPSIRERFLREGKIANRVEHAARVPVTDDDTSDAGEPFLVMDLLEGETLQEACQRAGGALPTPQVLGIFDTVLDLLARCHDIGIVHRDIKPSNIFLTSDGAVKVLDFGVARMRDHNSRLDATRAGTAIGTPSYTAPEQALGLVDQVDRRSDIWSVGACIYTALTGKRLNEARSEAESFVVAATQAAPSIANAAPELPVEVVAFVDRSLAYERERRFQDARSMRGELLGLLAAIRAGQLGARISKPSIGLRIRSNEIADEDEESSSKTKKAIHERLAAMWKLIGVCLADMRQYGWGHPNSARSLRTAFEQTIEALAAHPTSIYWEVGAAGFSFNGAPVWAPDRMPFDRIPYQLFGDGVRRIQLKEGITEEEFRDLVGILVREASSVGPEDDAVTALWDRRFEHVAYVAIDSFEEGGGALVTFEDTSTLADQIAELAQLDRDEDEVSLAGRAMQINLATRLKESGESASALMVEPLTKATLGAQLNLGEEKWRERFVDAFAEGYMFARGQGTVDLLESALREWTVDQLALHGHTLVFDMFRAITTSLAQRSPAEALELERAFARVMLPYSTLSAVFHELAKNVRSPSVVEVDPALVAGVSRALDLLGNDSMLLAACTCYDAIRSEGMREVLTSYIKRWTVGNEAKLAELLGTCGIDLGIALAKLLGATKTPAAMAGLARAERNPHLRVRMEALLQVGDEKREQIRAELKSMLTHEKLEVRREALGLVVARALVVAGPTLVLRIQASTFHDLSLEERHFWLRALMDLSPTRADTLCSELLAKSQIVPTERIEATRVLAAELLADTSASLEAMEAARSAARKRWWNSAPVREAAERALMAITRRRDEGRRTKEASRDG